MPQQVHSLAIERCSKIAANIDRHLLTHPRAFMQVHYVLNNPPAGWTGASGFITSDLIKQHLPAPGKGVKILSCGPLPMNKAMKAHLDALGYTKDMQFEF